MESFDWTAFQEAVRKRRAELGLKQWELAERLGAAQGFVSEIESGKKKPSLDMLVKLAEALETTPSWFLSDTQSAEPKSGLIRTITLENVIMDRDYTVRGLLAFEGAKSGHAAQIAKALKFGHLQRSGAPDYRVVELAGVPSSFRAIDLRIPLVVRVEGEPTMIIPAGYVLIVDPDRAPQHADIVVAARDPSAEPDPEAEALRPPKAELRRYEEGPRGVPMLFRLDTDEAETLSQGWRIAGVVVEHRRPAVVSPSAE